MGLAVRWHSHQKKKKHEKRRIVEGISEKGKYRAWSVLREFVCLFWGWGFVKFDGLGKARREICLKVG